MKKRWICGVMAALVVLLLIGTALVVILMHRYPQRVITPEELYGAQLENLHDFTLDEQGNLTAQSTDPWILFDFGGETGLRQITVYLSEVQSTDAPYFYLLPNYDVLSAQVSDGRAVLNIPSSLDRHHITGIRLDLTGQVGAVLKVDRVVLNDTLDLVAMVARLMLCVAAMLALLTAEAWLWVQLLRRERQKLPLANLIPALLQELLKAALALVLCRPLIAQDSGDRQQLFCWLLVLSMECVCLGLVALRYFGCRRNQLWVMALIPFWGAAQFAGLELLCMARFDFSNLRYLALNLLGCCAVAWLLLVVLRWGALSLSLSTALFTLWAVANHYYGAIRGVPLKYSDIAQAGTAANVLDNYQFAPERLVLAVVLAGAIISVAAFAALGRCCWSWDWRRECCGVAGMAAAALAFLLTIPAFDLSLAWNLPAMSQQYGYLYSFSIGAKASLITEKPENYSLQRIDQIFEDEGAADQENDTDQGDTAPNIIVIMNEAFADLPDIYGFETDVDLMPTIHNMDNTITGTLLVSVFGGGTSNTEYEFLTGNSLYMMPVGCCPYVQYMSGQQQSIAWWLQSKGYSTAAYHPFSASNYQRSVNYPLLGLDPFYSAADNLPSQEFLRGLVTDSSDYQNIIWLYEQRDEDQPFFLFNVTMQNHGSYSADYPQVEVAVEPELEALQVPQMEEYLSLVHASDQAFRELTDYFSQVEEDTIILMFGDHQPSLSDTIAETLEGLYQEREGYANADNMIYQSTFVIWANFELEEASGVLTSPNYLRAMVLEQAGVELSAYDSLLLELRRQYPAMNAFSYLDDGGVWHVRGEEESQVLEDYACVVYNNVFDKKHMNEDYYF